MLLQQYLPFTVLKPATSTRLGLVSRTVATVLTVYGIETNRLFNLFNICYMLLQQYLPFTVLKPVGRDTFAFGSSALQQYLPFTVLKRYEYFFHFEFLSSVATVLTVYGIETF